MMKWLIFASLILLSTLISHAQLVSGSQFGKGINFISTDSTFTSKIAFRFQTLYTATGNMINGELESVNSNLLIRRARLKFDGYAYTPRLIYKVELALSNRDFGKAIPENGNTPNLVLDAVLKYKMDHGFSVWFGQTKLPGNRERVISSQKLQFVDRSLLNSNFNLDRDIGLQLRHGTTFGDHFILKNAFAISLGEGRNITKGNYGGYDYTYRLEILPFGEFKGKGDYVGGAIELENEHKVSIGFTYDYNNATPRSAGHLGAFVVDSVSEYVENDITTIFVDWMYKFRGFSYMGELAQKTTANSGDLYSDMFYSGSAMNHSVGIMLSQKWELAGRYTHINQTNTSASKLIDMYTLGLSKYISKHNLKFQTDFSLTSTNGGAMVPMFRFQTEMAF